MKKPLVLIPLVLLIAEAFCAWYFTRRTYLIQRAVANGKANGDENATADTFATMDTSVLLGLAYNF